MHRIAKQSRVAGPAVILSVLVALAAIVAVPAARAVVMDANAMLLTQLDDEWSKAAGAKDVDRVVSFYAEDAIAYPPGEPVAVGRAAARKVWATYLADPTFRISWKTVHAGVSKSGDLGFTAGTYEDSFKGPDGKVVREVGKYLCTWKKQKDGTWKAIHDMWNTDAK